MHRPNFSSAPAILTLWCAATAAADPLASAGCRDALAKLEAAEAGVIPSAGPAARDALAQAQRRAAQGCLTGSDDAAPAQAQRRAEPPISVPPVDATSRRPAAAASLATAPATPTLLPATVPRPQAPLSATCDPAGCWASDGTRVQRLGPALIGPRGFCSSVGGLLQCP